MDEQIFQGKRPTNGALMIQVSPMRCIGRRASRQAWYVDIRRSHQLFRSVFSDSVYGGKKASLRAAQAWRDEIFATHPGYTKEGYATQLRPNNTSGVAGVSLYTRSTGTQCWKAVTVVNGRPISRSFRIDLHGYEQAFALAVKERQRQLTLFSNELWRP
ncbi:hypothetical protein [Variovorax ginsengisoli]|uniref:AP2 domain-containing protein n=1 Tax=Variovorax ginsengisoli TaxID=363844 RepID=A0ABT9S588_9BURK|nr:hypothetical protein [Variovorax ginsengisoli]MDP9899532.1 hypothetical protein [Variovorax ginsengisoli]